MTTINSLEKLAAWIVFSLAILMVYSFLSVAWANESKPLDFTHIFDAMGAEDVWTLYTEDVTPDGSFTKLTDCEAWGNELVAHNKAAEYTCTNFPPVRLPQ